jgi:hypothetical protein
MRASHAFTHVNEILPIGAEGRHRLPETVAKSLLDGVLGEAHAAAGVKRLGIVRKHRVQICRDEVSEARAIAPLRFGQRWQHQNKHKNGDRQSHANAF